MGASPPKIQEPRRCRSTRHQRLVMMVARHQSHNLTHNDGSGRLLGCLHGLQFPLFFPSCQGSPGSFASFFEIDNWAYAGFSLGVYRVFLLLIGGSYTLFHRALIQIPRTHVFDNCIHYIRLCPASSTIHYDHTLPLLPPNHVTLPHPPSILRNRF
ncbi:hypothetical protein B0H21DRAFT_717792 [Amylocystis lapponica]|nr:hypothetical protein B0H21DRAFT_717792 [Amylocystis lapponica]